MAVLRQKTAFGPGVYRGRKITAEMLKQYAEGTNKAIAAGVPIPLLSVKHAPINANDADTAKEAETQGAGWITKVDVDPESGAIEWEAKDVPSSLVNEISEGHKRYTSPEFRSHYECEKAGVYTGPVIRHFTFTPVPGNPHQGPVETIALEELGVFQFSESECEQFAEPGKIHSVLKKYGWKNIQPGVNQRQRYGNIDGGNLYYHPNHDEHIISVGEGGDHAGNNPGVAGGMWSHGSGDMADNIGQGTHKDIDAHLEAFHKKNTKTNGPGHQHAETPTKKKPELDEEEVDVTPTDEHQSRSDNVDTPVVETNPDMPPIATDMSKLKAIVAGLAQKGIVLPSDWNPVVPGAMDILLGCLNSNIATENAAEVESAKDAEQEEQPTESAMPYSEIVGTEQFGEGSYDKIMRHHGYDPIDSDDPGWSGANDEKLYLKGGIHEDDSHVVGVKLATGEWAHEHYTGGGQNVHSFRGKGAQGLHHYLTGVHHAQNKARFKTSQHDEQFTEAELAALPPKARKAIEDANTARLAAEAQAAQFAESEVNTRNAAALERTTVALKACRIPPGLKTRLLAAYEGESAVQFSEGQDQKLYTALEVAEMFAASIPPSLQFSEDDVKPSKQPKANTVIGKDPVTGAPLLSPASSDQFFEEGSLPTGHISPERAEELAAASPGLAPRNKDRFNLGSKVAANTAKNPSKCLVG